MDIVAAAILLEICFWWLMTSGRFTNRDMPVLALALLTMVYVLFRVFPPPPPPGGPA